MPALFSPAALQAYTADAAKQPQTVQAQAPVQQKPSWFDDVAKTVGIAGMVGDGMSTAYAVTHGFREADPMYTWLGDQKAAIPVYAGMNLATYLAAKKWIQPTHPKLFDAIMLGSGIGHGAAMVHNLHALAGP